MATESGNKIEWDDYPEGAHPCEVDYKPGRRQFLRSAGSASVGAAAIAASGCKLFGDRSRFTRRLGRRHARVQTRTASAHRFLRGV